MGVLRRVTNYFKSLYPVKLLMLLILIVLLGLGYISYRVSNDVYRANSEREEVYENMLTVSSLRSDIIKLNRGYYAYLDNDSKKTFAELVVYRRAIFNELDALWLSTGENSINQKIIEQLSMLIGYRFDKMALLSTYKVEHNQDAMFALMKKININGTEILNILYTIEKDLQKKLAVRNDQVILTQSKTSSSILFGTIITCLLFIIIIYLLSREIAERKRVELEIRQEMQFTERLLNSSIDGILSYDTDCKVVLWNPGMETLTGISKSKIIGRNIFDVFPVLIETREDAFLLGALKGRFTFSKDRWISIEETEKEFYYEAYYSPVYDITKGIIGGLGVVRNTTQRKLASEALEKAHANLEKRVIERTAALSKANDELKKEILHRKSVQEQINQSLQEKVILLQEIHHRVKNNLQVVSSLFNLQSGYISDPKSLEMFRESQNRVRSMALIHERLYQSKDLNRIEFSSYINSLCRDLFNSYNIDPGRVSLNLNLSGTYIEIDTSITCGLIINELVSNSLKHAFPGKTTGEIYVCMEENENNWVTLIIKDTGKGFPSNVDYKNTSSLGLQLVNTLTEQLGGTIDLNTDPHTEFIIKFRNKETIRNFTPSSPQYS